MKWRLPKNGDTRTQKGFLWFPQKGYTSKGQTEIRWLEKAVWEEEFFASHGWKVLHWIDKDTKDE